MFTCSEITIKTQSMDKEEIRSIMGELIRLQAIIKEMEKSGFQWEKVQEISDSLRLLVIDLENTETKRERGACKASQQGLVYEGM